MQVEPTLRSSLLEGRVAIVTGGSRGIGGATAGKPADYSHKHHGDAKDVQNVDAEEIGPRRIAVTENKFLETKQNAEAKDFRAAQDGLFRNFISCDALFAKLFRD